MGSPNRLADRWGLVIAIVVCLACLVPFLGKAYHIDDTLFLLAARQIQSHPADFYGFRVNWYLTEMPMSRVTKNPPLACYYLAVAGWLVGWREVGIHLAFLLPAAGAAWGTYRLAQRFCSLPLIATLTAVLTPAFLVSSTSVMCDTLMLCFWVWAIFYWYRGLVGARPAWLWVAAGLIGLGFLTKYFAISLIPLLGAYTLVQRRSVVEPAIVPGSVPKSGHFGYRLASWLVPLLAPLLVVLGYQLATHELYGMDLLQDAMAYAKQIQTKSAFYANPIDKLLIGLAFTGGCLSSVFFFFPVLWSRRTCVWAIVATLLLMYGLYVAGKIGPFKLVVTKDENHPVAYVRWTDILQAGIMIAAGAGVLALGAWQTWRNRDAGAVLLGLWVAGAFVFTAFVNWTVNARSILPAAPAMGILVARRLSERGRRGAWTYAPLVPAAAVALLVTHADAQLAGSARQAAQEAYSRYGNGPGHLWFEGHWGFQYYMSQLGARSLDMRHVDCRPGDVAVLPLNNCDLFLLPGDSTEPLDPLSVKTSSWVATMHQVMLAGFYASGTGPLPFVFGDVPPDKYMVYRVTKPVHGALHFSGEPERFDVGH